jgi:anti-sigma regulatory factor (Ser/Thr protein kinase)
MNVEARTGLLANIANFVRQEIRVPKSKPLLPVFEAVANSVDAIADRAGPGTITVTVRRDPDLIEGQRGLPHTVIIEDDGVGFNDANIASFDELYSEKKMHQGGKGRGRFKRSFRTFVLRQHLRPLKGTKPETSTLTSPI